MLFQTYMVLCIIQIYEGAVTNDGYGLCKANRDTTNQNDVAACHLVLAAILKERFQARNRWPLGNYFLSSCPVKVMVDELLEIINIPMCCDFGPRCRCGSEAPYHMLCHPAMTLRKEVNQVLDKMLDSIAGRSAISIHSRIRRGPDSGVWEHAMKLCGQYLTRLSCFQ